MFLFGPFILAAVSAMPIRMESAPPPAAADTTAAAASSSELPEIKSEIKAEDFCELTPAPPQQQQHQQLQQPSTTEQQQPTPLQSPDQQHLGSWVG